ncbi:MAG: cystathionine beta-lyase [Proteobacteria bacterium]|nr:cystathionine beta-lyase [Pseudomonadota bacterium]
MKKDTILAHAGRDSHKFEGVVNTPVVRASTILFPTVKAYEASHADRFTRMRYGRYGTQTTHALEEAVAELEGGHGAMICPSGAAAIAAALLAFTKVGDHILMVDTAYTPSRLFSDSVLRHNGVETTYYDPLIGNRIAELIRPNTRLVYCESPGSLTFEVQDIPAIAAAAHARGIPVLNDNTWATPYFFSSFEHGVDVSIHAATKYIGGHSDIMMGIIVTTEAHWRTVRTAVADYGYYASPDDCFMALRGLRTLGVRLKQHQTNALAVAAWLQRHRDVARVMYPALEGDAGHALWRREFTGASGLFGVELKPAPKAAVDAMLDGFEFFGMGASWGGFESLVLPTHPERTRTATRFPAAGPTLRLHIGLEDPDDLIADLEAGFDRLRRIVKQTG